MLMIAELRNLRMIWVKQRVWRRIYMIGLVERGGLLPSLLELLAAEFGDEAALKWDEC